MVSNKPVFLNGFIAYLHLIVQGNFLVLLFAIPPIEFILNSLTQGTIFSRLLFFQRDVHQRVPSVRIVNEIK